MLKGNFSIHQSVNIYNKFLANLKTDIYIYHVCHYYIQTIPGLTIEGTFFDKMQVLGVKIICITLNPHRWKLSILGVRKKCLLPAPYSYSLNSQYVKWIAVIFSVLFVFNFRYCNDAFTDWPNDITTWPVSTYWMHNLVISMKLCVLYPCK